MPRPKEERTIAVARLIKHMRNARGLSIKEAAALVDAHPDTFTRWEGGTVPSLPRLNSITKKFGYKLVLTVVENIQ